MPNVLKMNTKVDKHPKAGSRNWDKKAYDDFDFNYQGIDWNKKARDPNEPVCPVCNGESVSGTCAGCV